MPDTQADSWKVGGLGVLGVLATDGWILGGAGWLSWWFSGCSVLRPRLAATVLLLPFSRELLKLENCFHNGEKEKRILFRFPFSFSF